MPESPAAAPDPGQGSLSTHPIARTQTREVRVHYGQTAITVSVVEIIHTNATWRGSAKLLTLRQFTRAEFERGGRLILEACAIDLLLPLWPLSEGDSDL